MAMASIQMNGRCDGRNEKMIYVEAEAEMEAKAATVSIVR